MSISAKCVLLSICWERNVKVYNSKTIPPEENFKLSILSLFLIYFIIFTYHFLFYHDYCTMSRSSVFLYSMAAVYCYHVYPFFLGFGLGSLEGFVLEGFGLWGCDIEVIAGLEGFLLGGFGLCMGLWTWGKRWTRGIFARGFWALGSFATCWTGGSFARGFWALGRGVLGFGKWSIHIVFNSWKQILFFFHRAPFEVISCNVVLNNSPKLCYGDIFCKH